MFKKTLKFSRNFYFLTGVSFLVWMLFFDTNDIYSQYQLRKKLSELQSEKEFYQEKIEEVNSDREALINDKEAVGEICQGEILHEERGGGCLCGC